MVAKNRLIDPKPGDSECNGLIATVDERSATISL